MSLIDNINVLKRFDRDIWEELRLYEEEKNRKISKVEKTRTGTKTLVIVQNEKAVYFHSKYDPLKEAETIIESYGNINTDSNIIFYGTGMGYHIKLLLEKHPNIKYYIYEPVPELMYHFISNVDLKEFKEKEFMGVSIGLDDIGNSISRLVDVNKGNLVLVELPSHKKNFPEEHKRFNKMFLKSIKNKRSKLVTNYSFQKRWVVNSMKNFKTVLSTPNILLEKAGEFKNVPAILVAAGPSLNEEIENLRYIKDNGLAYIFSVGSAINTLVNEGIYPHAACTYDPTARNQIVFEITKEKGIKEIPMIFGSSVGYETLQDYLGDFYHMITSQDTVSSYYLEDERDGTISIVQDAPSIAVVTIQLLYQLGFSSIILVGQNLAYKGKKRHSAGIHYSNDVTEEEIEKGIWVKDVSGNDILTDEGFNSMRNQMEYYIKQLPNIQVINTTKDGAHIEGTKFIELEKIIEQDLKQTVVKEDWLEGIETKYSKEYLIDQVKAMDRAYEKAIKVNKEYYTILERIDKLITNRNFKQAEKMYVKLDRELRRIENNDYYKVFILPMNRVQYKMLADNIDSLNETRDPYEKGKKIVEDFKTFIDICNKDIVEIKPIYEEMKKDIVSYTEASL